MTCPMDDLLGPYVLHALEPRDADAIRRHLPSCAACREEAVSLASTASVLGRLTVTDIERLYDLDGGELAPRDADRRRTRPRRRAALALAAAVLAAVATLGAVRELGDRPGPSNPTVVEVADPATHVRAALAMTGQPWGTQLHLTLADAYPSGWCSLVAHSRDGRSETAASWVADPDGSAAVDGVTAIPRSQLSELDVVTDTGERLVRITLPPAVN
jgi:hypothetical protein